MMVSPKTEADLSEAIASAKGPLRIIGGGTRPVGKPVAGQGLSVAGLMGIHLYEPGALTLVAATGTPLAEINATLDAENQRLAFEPMDHRGLLGSLGTSTIGGVVAANISGPRRLQVGACRDFLLGVRFVDGTGTVLKNGGRVMKNVTGYDLVKLLAGSFGTLGVMSEVALKVLPKAETQAALVLDGLDDSQAVAALSAAVGSPYDISGAAHVRNGKTLIRLEGFADSVSYRCRQLREKLAAFGDVSVLSDPAKCARMWCDIRDVKAFHGSSGDVWRISVKPSDNPEICARLGPYAQGVQSDWAGGLIWAELPPGTDARALMRGIKGHARIERASDETKSRLGVFGSDGTVAEQLAVGLRRKFDPRGMLNQGLMG